MFFKLLHYLGGFFLGWGLGANDSANVFGVAVGSRMVKWRIAAILTAVFVLIGAVLQGRAGIETLAHSLNRKHENDNEYVKEIHVNTENGSLEIQYAHYHVSGKKIKKANVPLVSPMEDPDHPGYHRHQFKNAMIMSFAAAFTIIILTILKLPGSTSQAIVGAIIGLNLLRGGVQWSGLIKVVLCWIGTPVGAIIFTVIFYYVFRKIINTWKPSVLVYDRTITFLLIITGCYGAYALGANNVANVTAVFVTSKALTVTQAEWFGGIAIAVGVITYSKPVMMTVGSNIVKLDAFMAFITVLALAVTVWIYALIGVPVSTTQAIVGAVFGFAFIKGAQTVNFKTLGKIGIGWLATPIMGGVFSATAYYVSNLYYIPNV